MFAAVRQQRDEAVTGGRGFAAALQQSRIAGLGRRRVEAQPAQVLGQHEGHHGLEHRHLDILTLAFALAVQQRSQHRIDHRQAGGLVGHQRGREVGLVAAIADQRGDAASGLDHVVEGRAVRVWPFLAVAGGLDIDDFRVDRRDRVVAQAQALDRRHAHVVHQHVGALYQLLHGLAAGIGLQVYRDRALVAVDRQEDRSHAGVQRHAVRSHQVAFQALDFDHVGAVVAQDLGRQRPQHHRGQVDHPDAGQRAGGRWGGRLGGGWGCVRLDGHGHSWAV